MWGNLTKTSNSGGKHWTGLHNIKCPILSFCFYFLYSTCLNLASGGMWCILTFPSYPQFWRSIWMLQQREFSLCSSIPPLFSLTHVALNLHFVPPSTFMSIYQCLFYSCWKSGSSCQSKDQAAFLGWWKYSLCADIQMCFAAPPQHLSPCRWMGAQENCSCWWSSGNHNRDKLLTPSAVAKVLEFTVLSWARNKERARILSRICILLTWPSR